jgi:hypothetical protein
MEKFTNIDNFTIANGPHGLVNNGSKSPWFTCFGHIRPITCYNTLFSWSHDLSRLKL